MSKRLLFLEILNGNNLTALNSKSQTSDPFVVAHLEGISGREIKSEKFQTQVILKNLKPIWNEKMTFGNNYDLNSSGELPTLVLSVYHKGGYLMSDEFMGKAVIPLDTIDPNGGEARGRYPLSGDSRKTQITGEVN